MFTNRDLNFFELATSLAKVSNHDQYYLGAAIVKNGSLLATGTNENKSHPLQMKYNVYRNLKGNHHSHHIHAEIASLIKVKNKNLLQNSSIYVSRIGRDKGIKMSRPCKGCMRALKDHGIKDIFYTTESGGYCFERLN